MNRSDDAVAHIERSVTVAQEQGLLQVACRGYANLGVLYCELDPGRAIETCLNGLEVAKKVGDLSFQSRLCANLAVAYCTLTNQCSEQGIGAAKEAIELDRRLGQLDHLAVPLIVLGQIYQCHGEPDLALSHYQEAMGLAEEVGEPQLLFPCYDGLAMLYLEMGDKTQAERYMLKAQQVCEQAGVDPIRSWYSLSWVSNHEEKKGKDLVEVMNPPTTPDDGCVRDQSHGTWFRTEKPSDGNHRNTTTGTAGQSGT